jgi:saccharopine dehydrogenase-like NADP-dependent oxidoreductase
MNNVLILGAGLVTKPIVKYLLDLDDIKVTVASRTVSKAEALIENNAKGVALALDVNNDNDLENIIKENDIVISLLPYTFHVKVAGYCLKYLKHLVTTSYVSPAMQNLDKEATEKGLLFLNEIGLDPGIDHMSAMKIIDEIKSKGGKVISFESICGGLPAPEANDNPFGYKFSWSPRGVVMAGRNNARFLKNGDIVNIEGKDLFKNYWQKEVESLGKLEVYPNRDSLIYKELYGLNDAQTIFRGTFRNLGWCDTIYSISKLGFLDDTKRPELIDKTLSQIVSLLINLDDNVNLKDAVCKYLNLEKDSEVIKKLEWLGLFSNNKVKSDPTYLDILANRMLELMPYKPGERDMIVLQHDFIAEYENNKKEHITSLLIDYGIPYGDTSMARTVSLPAAIAVKLILQNRINAVGVKIPVIPEIYLPVMEELEKMNIKFKETIKTL